MTPDLNSPRPQRVPAVDVWQADDGFAVVADVPGATAESVKLSAERGTLVLYAEAARATYTRSFQLPDGVDPDAITAKLDRGQLEIFLPRVPSVRSRQIRVVSA